MSAPTSSRGLGPADVGVGVAAAGLLVACLLLGFGLDAGELACEQAAAHLIECCPELDPTRMDCSQAGGCSRSEQATTVAEEESDCIRDSSCEDILARRVCERLDARIIAAGEAGGPSAVQLYEADWLCD